MLMRMVFSSGLKIRRVRSVSCKGTNCQTLTKSDKKFLSVTACDKKRKYGKYDKLRQEGEGGNKYYLKNSKAENN